MEEELPSQIRKEAVATFMQADDKLTVDVNCIPKSPRYTNSKRTH
jgi:hypothetical protein